MKIKTISKLIIFSAIILTIGIKTSNAENIPAILYINANDVFIRSTPTTSGKILGRAYFGYSAKFLKKTDNKVKIGKWNNYWYHIEIESHYKHMTMSGITGWVYGEFISFKEPVYKTKHRVVNDKKLNEALFKAVKNKNIPLVLELLKKGADPNYINVEIKIEDTVRSITRSTRRTVLLNAISSFEIVKLLLEHGANPNLKGVESSLAFEDFTPIVSAIRLKNIPAIKLLLDYGADPDLHAGSSGGGTWPIIEAIRIKKIEIVRLLLNKDVSLNRNLFIIGTPLSYAIKQNLPEIAALLRKHGAKLVVEEN